jgi:hypothetical protein
MHVNYFFRNVTRHEYKSEVLQTPDEETLTSEPHEDIRENCPKCNHILGPDFYWE